MSIKSERRADPPFCHKCAIYKDRARSEDCYRGGKHEWAQRSENHLDRRCPYHDANGVRCPLDEHHALFADPMPDPPTPPATPETAPRCVKRRGARANGRQCVRDVHADGDCVFGPTVHAGCPHTSDRRPCRLAKDHAPPCRFEPFDPLPPLDRPPGVQLPPPHVGPKVTPAALADAMRTVLAPILASQEAQMRELGALALPVVEHLAGEGAKLRRVVRRQAKAAERCAAALESIAAILDQIDARIARDA